LPTEAEWEYAARGGSNASRYGDLDEIAWDADNSGREHLDSTRLLKYIKDTHNALERYKENGNGMHEVGQKRANGFGLFDMLGNVWEWVNDWYGEKYYKNSPSQDPAGPAGPNSDKQHIYRGGSWFMDPTAIRVSLRIWLWQGWYSFYDLGFRCGGEVSSNPPAALGSKERSTLSAPRMVKIFDRTI